MSAALVYGFLDVFKEVSAEWLLRGIGEMTIDENDLIAKIALLEKEIAQLKTHKNTSTRVLVELDVDADEFIKLGLKDKIIQILNR